MKISAKTEYACIAMLELAARYGAREPVRIRKIAERHGVPPRFLVQILLQLKGAGFVASTRGAAGGYHLIMPPDEVSLGQVMEVIEGGDEDGVGQGVQRVARLAGREGARSQPGRTWKRSSGRCCTTSRWPTCWRGRANRTSRCTHI